MAYVMKDLSNVPGTDAYRATQASKATAQANATYMSTPSATPTASVFTPKAIASAISTPSYAYNSTAANNTYMGTPKATPTPTSTVPTYNFTQTPAQNAAAGNNAGYPTTTSSSSNRTTNTPTTPVDYSNYARDSMATGTPTTPTTPKPTTDIVPNQYNQYQSQYTQQILDTLAKMLNYPTFNYDPNNDAGLKQAQSQSEKLVMQNAAKKGRVFDTYTDVKMKEASQGLIPSYQAAAQNQYNADRSNVYSTLGALQTLDNTGYSRDYAGQQFNQNANQQLYQNKVTDAGITGMFNNKPTTAEQDRVAKSANNVEDRAIAAQDRAMVVENNTRAQEIQDYGVVLSPVARQYKAVYQSMPQQQRAEVDAYSSNFAAEIIRRTEIDKNDPLIPYLVSARNMKILSSPNLMQQYGADINMANPAVQALNMKMQNAQIEQQTTIIKNQIEIIKAQYAGLKEKTELDKVIAELDVKKYDAATKRLELLNLPAKQKNDLAGQIADIAYKNAATTNQYSAATENQARTKLIGEQVNTEKAQQANYYASATKTGKETIDSSLFAQALNQMKDAPDQNKWLMENAPILQRAGANAEFFGKLKGQIPGKSDAVDAEIAKIIQESVEKK